LSFYDKKILKNFSREKFEEAKKLMRILEEKISRNKQKN